MIINLLVTSYDQNLLESIEIVDNSKQCEQQTKSTT